VLTSLFLLPASLASRVEAILHVERGSAKVQVVVNVSKDILQWIINQSGKQNVASNIMEKLSSWLTDEKKPTYHQIEAVSKATGIPFGYFFLKKPPNEDLSIVDYRTVDSVELLTPSRNLIETMKNMETIQDWMHSYLRETIDRCTYVGAMKNQNDSISFANYVCNILSIGDSWRKNCNSAADLFKILRKAISNSGTLVMLNGVVGNNTHRQLDIHEFRAFAMVDDIVPLIFINNNDSENGKLFSLLHEFAHICLGESSLFNEPIHNQTKLKSNEVLCNAVAAEVLVPTKQFVEVWETFQGHDAKDKIVKIAKMFCCGVIVVARKALDNGFIDSNYYNNLSKDVNKAFQEKLLEKRSGGGDYYKTASSRIDRNFLICLSESVASGKTAYTDAFKMTNTNRKTYANLMDTIGGLR